MLIPYSILGLYFLSMVAFFFIYIYINKEKVYGARYRITDYVFKCLIGMVFAPIALILIGFVVLIKTFGKIMQYVAGKFVDSTWKDNWDKHCK